MSNTGTSIAIIEKNMPMDRITPLVEALDMDKKRFMATVLLACERTPSLMDFPVQQHVMWASAAAALGLEPDGVSGQAFPIPFKGNNPKIQLIIGYKGFTTMAGRAGITINSGAILEGDQWDHKVHAGAPFAIEQAFGDRARRNMVGVWAQAQMPNGAYAHPLILDLSEVMAVKAKSPGARKKDSPWNDAGVGFQAMAQKTAVRRLQRTLPSLITPGRTWSTHASGMQMDMLHEEVGKASHVDLDGHVHDDGTLIDATVAVPAPEIEPKLALPNGTEFDFKSWRAYSTVVNKIGISPPEAVKAIHELNKERLVAWRASDNPDAEAAAAAITVALLEATP